MCPVLATAGLLLTGVNIVAGVAVTVSGVALVGAAVMTVLSNEARGSWPPTAWPLARWTLIPG